MLIASSVAEPTDLHRVIHAAHGFGRFVRSLVGLDRQAATTAFAEFLDGRTASADQIQFVHLIVDYLTRYGTMSPKLLFESPLTDNAPSGIASVFPPVDAAGIIAVVTALNDTADAG